ncbi:hypothetical protein AGMMS50262_15560 [Bacteroidia bacterium]|nr:hypothetical protein AGMMS50262_15560 [Bacteroidia bacterium]
MKTLFFTALFICSGLGLQAQYTGTPYPGGIPHSLPGIVEAEHFDAGGEDISWHDANSGQEANAGNYRPDTDVEFEFRDNDNYNIGWSGGGEWLKYTVSIETGGYYRASFNLASDGDRIFYATIDEVEICRFNTNTHNWGTFQDYVAENLILLPRGVHVITIYPEGNNIDRFQFDYIDGSVTENPEPMLRLTELMSNNVSAVMDEAYNYSMWVEVHNTGTELEYASNYYFTDNLAQPRKWTPAGQWIAGGAYALFWFERADYTGHAPFKLSPEGGNLYLLDKNENILDQVTYPRQYRNVSYGKTGDNGEWVYFTGHSAGASNSGKQPVSAFVCTKPNFLLPGGFYTSAVQIQFETPFEGETIHYTTDASEPTITSPAYSPGTAIQLSKTTCVRAVAFADNHIPSEIVTATYFINERKFNLPVVSIVTQQENLTDNTIGIYVGGTNGISGNCADARNWNRDWDRPANMELIDTTGMVRINQELDIAVAGGCSRNNPQKSLKLSPRKKFGDNRLRYDFFASKPGKKYKDIQIRNSGNDFGSTMMRDALMQSLIIGRMDIDYLAYEPAVCFMNGEYYGIQNLRERSSKDYLYTNYGLDEDEFILIDNQTAASNQEYNDLFNYVRNNNLASSSVYQTVSDQLDVEEYMNYMIAQIFYSNIDWPHNNYKIWKKFDGGRWRLILFDTDFGFSHSPNPNYDHNTVRYVFQESDERITLPLRRLVNNAAFKKQFINHFCVQVSSTFATNRVNTLIDSLSAKIRSEMVYHKQKWGGGNFDAELNVMKTFAKYRPDRVMQYLGQQFFQSAPVRNVAITSNIDSVSFTFNGEPVPDNPVTLKYFKNNQIEIQSFTDSETYCFQHWEISEAPHETVLIAQKTQWKYFDSNRLPASDWNKKEYNDESWKNGNAPLGYGSFEKNTTISYGTDANNKYSTAYFRKTFSIDDIEKMENFIAAVWADDGAVVYLNGQEVFRFNMPAGNVSYSTFSKECNDGVNSEFAIPKTLFQPGENVLAVEVHQCTSYSSDLIFDFNLTCTERLSGSDVSIVETPLYSARLSDNISLKAVYAPCGLGQKQVETGSLIRVYPAVTEEIVSIENAAGLRLQINSITGLTVYKSIVPADHLDLNIGFLPCGIYIVKIDKQAFKVIKQ